MENRFSDLLHQLIRDANSYAANDVLVNVSDSKNCIPFSENEILEYELLNPIYQKNQRFIKETGTSMLCITKGVIDWNLNSKEVKTPLIIIPVSVSLNKVTKKFSYEYEESDAIVNPYLVNRLEKEFEIGAELPKILEELVAFLLASGFKTVSVDEAFIGNFHHHRFVHLKELERINQSASYSNALGQLLGETVEVESTLVSKLELLPADDDHRAVFKAFEHSNCVVQGPPGTGKSQLLINFIGKFLLNKQSQVVVSEKRAALEVIEKKLTGLGLSPLTYLSASDWGSKSFIESLHATWDFFEKLPLVKNAPVYKKEDLENNLELTFQILANPKLIGEISYTRFHKLSTDCSLENFTYFFSKPDLALFERNETFIKTLFEKELNQLIGTIRFSVFETSQLEELFKNVAEMSDFSTSLSTHFNAQTWGEMDQILQESVNYNLFQNEGVRKFHAIIHPESEIYESFLKVKNAYLKAKIKAEKNGNLSEWKIVPSEVEVHSLLQEVASTNFWEKRRFKKRWNEISNISLKSAKKSLDSLIQHFKVKEQILQAEQKLIAFGLTDFDVDLSQIELLKSVLSTEKWKIYEELSAEKRIFLDNFGAQLDRFRVFIKHYFTVSENVAIHKLLSYLKKRMSEIIPLVEEIKQLNQSCFELLAKSNNFFEFKTSLFGSHFADFKGKYPRLSRFEVGTIEQEIETIINQQTLESELISHEVLQSVNQKFKYYQEILATPAVKLSAADKVLKKELKIGKAILIKEFNKSRNHPPMRLLFESEAKIWIQLLKPVWLSNSSQLATCFPFEKELFDVCILDEASQIPLENGLGTLYRSKKAIIAGDEKQMGPSSFFKKEKENQLSLLHQASYYFNKKELKHHYRSQHPDLIAFSNTHFYNGELNVFPSYYQKENPITFHYQPEGKFNDRQNKVEAEVVANLISEALQKEETVGIVAFSQEQVDCVLNALSADLRLKLENRIEELTAFIKPLEKVQGDECEHLIISTAYAKNDLDQFQLKFGPLNRTSGRNRLNVLFSRASKRIDFVTSMLESDLKLSTNESVNLLRNWLHFASTDKKDSSFTFPFHLTPEVNGNKLTFHSIYEKGLSVNEVATIQNVLKSRGWKISYD